MKNSSRIYCTSILIFTTIGLMGSARLAVAEQTSQKLEEVVVTAPIESHRTVGRSYATGASIDIIELRREVGYADLDLSQHKDVMELENRIAAVAKDSCEKLSGMFLEGLRNTSEIQSCTAKAIRSTREAERAAIEAAE